MNAPALPFTCPVCGKKLMARISLAMQHGMNVGHGDCIQCDTFLALKVAPGGQHIDAIRWSDHRWKQISGLPHDSPDVANWRSDRLLEQLRAGKRTITWAIRYALKQPHREIFLSALTFAAGAQGAFRAEAARQRARAFRAVFASEGDRWAERAQLLDRYGRGSRP